MMDGRTCGKCVFYQSNPHASNGCSWCRWHKWIINNANMGCERFVKDDRRREKRYHV